MLFLFVSICKSLTMMYEFSIRWLLKVVSLGILQVVTTIHLKRVPSLYILSWRIMFWYYMFRFFVNCTLLMLGFSCIFQLGCLNWPLILLMLDHTIFRLLFECGISFISRWMHLFISLTLVKHNIYELPGRSSDKPH